VRVVSLSRLRAELFFIDEYYRGGWVHDKTRRRRVGRLLQPRVARLTPAEADRKAKPVSGLEKTPAFIV